MPIGIGRGRGIRKSNDVAKSVVGKTNGHNDKDDNDNQEFKNNYSYSQNKPIEQNNINNEDSILTFPLKVNYVPDDNIADYKMFTNTGINFDKYQNIKVNVTGKDVPPAATTIASLELPEFLRRNISDIGFTKLTPIQKITIPMILNNRDFIACAQTGSGKTAAFLFPIIKSIYEEKETVEQIRCNVTSPSCIILVPTRELCRQAFTFCKMYCQGSSNIKTSYCYGGVQMNFSLTHLRFADILAVTPGRLVFLLQNKIISLGETRFIVLDEADRLLQADSFNECIELLFSSVTDGKPYQVSMFSATFPKEVQYYAKTFLREYLFVSVGEVGEACHDINQKVIATSGEEKLSQAMQYIENEDTGKTLVFVCSKRQADFYGIRMAAQGLKVTTIHGDRDQSQRETALNDFKCDRVQYLVATDVASRGLDIPKVDTVINVDMPETIDIYVHRIGRTGRCGNVGCSVSFFDGSKDARLATGLVQILSQAGQECPSWLKMIGGGMIEAREEERMRRRDRQDARSDVERSTLVMNGGGSGGYNKSAPSVQPKPLLNNDNDEDEDW